MFYFNVVPRPTKEGGGWYLRMKRDDEEIGGEVFSLNAYGGNSEAAFDAAYEKGSNWLNSKPEAERRPRRACVITDDAGQVFDPPPRSQIRRKGSIWDDIEIRPGETPDEALMRLDAELSGTGEPKEE